MTVTIDRATGDIVTDKFRVGHTSDVAMLRRLDKEHFELLDDNGVYKNYRVTKISIGALDVELVAHFKENHVWFFALQVVESPEDWQNWSEKLAAPKLRVLIGVMHASGMSNPEDLPWGHVQAGIDARSASTDLVVAYYKARR